MTFKSIKILLPLILFLLIKSDFAQDSQYWSQQYGTKSFYLGGAVIGSMLDLSASYYNPGAIALMENPEFLTGAKSITLTLFNFKDGAGQGHDIETLRADTPPDLFAGLFTFGKERQDRLVYSFLIRRKLKFRTSTSEDDLRDITNGSPGTDQYFGMTQIDRDISDTWVGLTYSRIINKNIGLGVTQYISYFSTYTSLSINSQALTADNQIPLTHSNQFLDTYNIKTLTKLGLFFDYSPITAGITMTLPSINLFGFGSYYYDLVISGQDIQNNTTENNYMDSYYLQDAKSYYPTSWTMGAGMSYFFNNTKLHISVEWFAPIETFKHLDLPPYRDKTSGKMQEVNILQEYKSVINFGFGWQHIFNKNFSLFGGATTDFTATPSGTISSVSVSNWDIYHLSVGTVFSYKQLKLNTGLNYAFGSESAKQIINFNSASLENFLQGEKSFSNINYKNLKLVIGFSLNLFENHKL